MEVSYKEEVWATSYGPTAKLKEAFSSCSNVILIYSVTESGRFQGFCRMKSLPGVKVKTVFKGQLQRIN
jgi:hypothetical protein